MTSIQKKYQSGPKRVFSLLAIAGLVFASGVTTFSTDHANAAQITARKLTLSSSSAAASNATTTYTFNFTIPSATVIQSAEAVICTTASGACTTPTGFLNSSSTLASQPTNPGDAAGWTVNTSTAGSLRLSKSGNVAAPTGSQTVVFGNVQNPTTSNQTFFARINTYSGASWTGAVDSGIVAAATTSQITLTGTMDEALTFCTGTSITGSNCGTVAGSAVNFGTFSSSGTSSGTSVMAASTNGGSGYAITVNGATMTCASCPGTPTIAALASQTASTTGSAQFGMNLRANTVPSAGADVSGTGTATVNSNHNTTNQFRYVTGDTVASAAAATNANTFTATYIVNVPGNQAAGTYSATMNYIATATF